MKNIRKFNSGKELNDSLVNEALVNVEFRQKLIDSPRITINNYANGEFFLSEETKVVVYDQSDTNFVYFNIPPKVDIDDIELTSNELEMVAGGGTSWTWSLLSGLICLGYQTAKHLDNCSCAE